jgi:type I restriction-modification system DNA methylase subunit
VVLLAPHKHHKGTHRRLVPHLRFRFAAVEVCSARAGNYITPEGQKKDGTMAGQARMNVILHDFPTTNIQSGGDGILTNPKL